MPLKIKFLSLPLLLLLISVFICTTSALSFLQWGQKCKIPSVGGGDSSSSLEAECDAGKGLICNGEACECTYRQRYSYDHVSGECRRKIGRPCHFIDLKDEKGQNELTKLPFNVKCHEYAECTLLSPPTSSLSDTDNPSQEDDQKISMCVCKGGLVPTRNFDQCIAPPPQLDVVVIPTTKPPRIVFRPAFFT